MCSLNTPSRASRPVFADPGTVLCRSHHTNRLQSNAIPIKKKLSVVIYDNDNGCYRDCAAGTWASPCNGSYECASCDPGYYCAGDCVDPVACPAGTSLDGYGASVIGDCENCPDGYYASEQGSATCFPCPAGHYCSTTDAAPVACPAGEYASVGALACSVCADGYYNALEAQEFCQACPAGYECSSKASEPTRCSSGSYSYGNATACESCPAGYYCSSTGSSPEVCTEGSYSLDNWAYCVACPPGAYCINTAQVWRRVSVLGVTPLVLLDTLPQTRRFADTSRKFKRIT